MTTRTLFLVAALALSVPAATAAPPGRWWADDVEQALARAKDNRSEMEKFLAEAPRDQRPGAAFLVANMPDADLRTLKAAFLLGNVDLAYKARREVPWGRDIPEEVFLNDVLPYANVDEKRDNWRQEMYDRCLPLARGCKSPAEAALRLNTELFKKLNVRYSAQRRAANQSPTESIARGTASCTGLSILLSDACRSVCVPARLVGTPLWANKRGNHTWVEVWDKGWHFTGACEPDPKGLDHGWFVGDAAQAQEDSVQHAIYAASFRKTSVYFPLVWARNNKDVPAENVTRRYAQKAEAADVVRLSIRVVDAGGKRVAVPVTVTAPGDPLLKREGTSRDESADLNDLLSFDLAPGKEYVVKAAGREKKVPTSGAVRFQVVEVTLPAGPDAGRSAAALRALRAAVAAGPVPPAELAGKDFATVPLTTGDAAAARALLWEAHAAGVRRARAEEVRARVLRDGGLAMPFAYTTFGDKPEGGRSLWISLHGGGNTRQEVNDRQWENQKKLYTVEEGVYLAPRAPTNTWNLWHEPHIDRLFGRLIEDLVVLESVNPDRVYLLGYSAGGDGVYQMAPRLADRWAAAAMMAGHPNGVSVLSLRNVPFALQVGANDAAYNRNKVAREYGEQLEKLRNGDPQGYTHFVKIHEGKGHWMGLEDKAALPWMAKFSRNPVPERVVWKQTGTPHDRSYWLAVPAGQGKVGSLVTARRAGQNVDLVEAEGVETLLIRFDDRLADLDKPVTVTRSGKELFSGVLPRTVAVMVKTLAGRGDPRLTFDAEVRVSLAGGEKP